MYQRTKSGYFRNLIEYLRFLFFSPVMIWEVLGNVWRVSGEKNILMRIIEMFGAFVAVTVVLIIFLVTGPFAALAGLEPKVHGH